MSGKKKAKIEKTTKRTQWRTVLNLQGRLRCRKIAKRTVMALGRHPTPMKMSVATCVDAFSGPYFQSNPMISCAECAGVRVASRKLRNEPNVKLCRICLAPDSWCAVLSRERGRPARSALGTRARRLRSRHRQPANHAHQLAGARNKSRSHLHD